MFMAVTAPHRVLELVDRTRSEWEGALPVWSRHGRLPLYRAVQPVLTRAVCGWAGVPLAPGDVPRRSRQLTALFDSAASGPLRHLASRFARMRLEAWLAALVADERAGRIVLPPESAARAAAWQRDDDNRLLPARIAAVELLNVLRPTVAVSVYIAFVAHALHEHPVWAPVLAEPGATAEAFDFVQEVRRHYPFFPAVAARVRQAFDWNGLHFPAGRRTLLDLYGTNHDARTWDDPQAFRPERWKQRQPGRFEFVPQGGADAATHHRCPGEDVVTQLLLLSLHMLLRRMRYEVAPQSRWVEMRRLPAIPRHGFIIESLQRLS
jgi:fatty-acid peroxygenase